MRAVLGFVCFIVLLAAAGCVSGPPSAVVNRWASQQGGVVTGSRQARAEIVARPLIACCQGRSISIQILATDSVGAFSWANGRVFVTRGLIDRLDDRELSAVIAHELGHLLTDGHLQTVASLKGCCVDPDAEVRADAAGVALLR